MIQNRPPTIVKGKVALLWLINRYGLTMISLAHKSNIRVEEIHKMVRGEAVERKVAEQVLLQLSRLAGIRYTLQDVYINIRMRGSHNEHNTRRPLD